MMTQKTWHQVLSQVGVVFSERDGFECHPFKMGGYKATVPSQFHLDYPDETMAVLVLSTPTMFQSSFKDWIVETWREKGERPSNPIDQFIAHRTNTLLSMYPGMVDVIHDHDLWPNRRPKVLMCACGHAVGAAFYYRLMEDEDLKSKLSSATDQKLIGVSLHPRFGGHFAFRLVLIFDGVSLPSDWIEKRPIDVLGTKDKIVEALTLFNLYWRDGRFRDCGSPTLRYDEQQLLYFSKPPMERWDIISDWFQ